MKKTHRILLGVTGACVALLVAFLIFEYVTLDKTAPVITCPEGVLKASVSITEEKLLKGVRAEDDHDGDLSSEVVIERLSAIGKDDTRTVTYAVMDQSGNVGRATRILKYKNYTPPRIRMDCALRAEGWEKLETVMEKIHAKSPLDGDLTEKIKYSFPDGGYIGGDGIYDIELRISDSAGSSTVIPTQVEIYSSQEQTIEIELSEYIVYLRKGAEFDPHEYYEIASQSGRLIVDSNVDTSVPGVYHAVYTVESDNSDDFGRTRLIVVVEE